VQLCPRFIPQCFGAWSFTAFHSGHHEVEDQLESHPSFTQSHVSVRAKAGLGGINKEAVTAIAVSSGTGALLRRTEASRVANSWLLKLVVEPGSWQSGIATSGRVWVELSERRSRLARRCGFFLGASQPTAPARPAGRAARPPSRQ
jgi:hypothetical protein